LKSQDEDETKIHFPISRFPISVLVSRLLTSISKLPAFTMSAFQLFPWSHFVPVNSQTPFCIRESTSLMIVLFIVFLREVPKVRSSPRVRRPLPSTVALSAALPQ
jgi:hypothetical protein